MKICCWSHKIEKENRKRKINLKPHQLPLKKKKKPFTKRFGESRYIKEKASNISINETLDLKKDWQEILEFMLDEKDQEHKEESVSSKEHKPDAFKNVLTLDNRDASLILKGIYLMILQYNFFRVYLMEKMACKIHYQGNVYYLKWQGTHLSKYYTTDDVTG